MKFCKSDVLFNRFNLIKNECSVIKTENRWNRLIENNLTGYVKLITLVDSP